MVDLFKAEQKVAHYRTRLGLGTEPETRAVLLKQLLAEEKDLGQTREQLARIDTHIEKLRRIIVKQEKRIGRLNFIAINTDRAILMLSTLNDLMATYQQHRDWITSGLVDGDGA